MKLTFIGAAHEVTGSCTLISIGTKNILVDCGMEQGVDTYENADLPILPIDIDAILLTHAHIDHSGKIPAMVASGYNGPIYSTVATHRLCEIMLRDSAHIQEFEAKWRSRKAKRAGEDEYSPIYTVADAEKALSLVLNVLNDGGIIVCETDIKEELPEAVGNYTVAKQDTYSKTKLTLYRYNGDDE